MHFFLDGSWVSIGQYSQCLTSECKKLKEISCNSEYFNELIESTKTEVSMQWTHLWKIFLKVILLLRIF